MHRHPRLRARVPSASCSISTCTFRCTRTHPGARPDRRGGELRLQCAARSRASPNAGHIDLQETLCDAGVDVLLGHPWGSASTRKPDGMTTATPWASRPAPATPFTDPTRTMTSGIGPPDPDRHRAQFQRQRGHPGARKPQPIQVDAELSLARTVAGAQRRRHPLCARLPARAPDHHRRVHGRAREPAGDADRQARTGSCNCPRAGRTRKLPNSKSLVTAKSPSAWKQDSG